MGRLFPTLLGLGLGLCLLTPRAMAAYQVNLDSPDDLGNAAAKAAANLVSFYSPNAAGEYSQTLVHWHESGIAWGSLLENHMNIGDGSQDHVAAGALVNASFGSVGDFLNGAQGRLTQEAWLGKWNDDIGHWALSAASGAEVFGAAAPMPGTGSSHTYTSLALTTYNEMWEQWDDKCGGGIYWSRDRSDASATDSTYKSTISNTLHMALGARLAVLDPANRDAYVAKGKQVYNWLTSSYLMTNTFRLYDGMHTGACLNITGTEYSYNQGMLIHALAYFYNATQEAYWLTQANAVLDSALALFVESGTNILRDSCEPTNQCNQGNLNGGSGFKGTLARAVAYLYPFTDKKRQTTIRTVLTASMQAALANACDSELFCNEVWTGAGAVPDKSPRSQITFMQLMNAFTRIQAASHAAGSTIDNAYTGVGDDGLNGGVFFGSHALGLPSAARLSPILAAGSALLAITLGCF
ncbi:hypothetical protein CXG81DRAFT_24481 [Caulochytrium protostelioides]|uniref:mannan endo-1,6-alpha-mannosidase n=1 Tax=Caulochytrium protostelioides TaxID=1555241 RepID=A0A4P9XCK8_9FUNG|nr:hypothetical protein CXG81DRAFT_24481 [Caulochytrium protostelioides]|eukprot:RKP02881.1 hypothetical protein CXG81DRAFT_24481 [Caulochytrium protostelioides]